MRKFRIRTCSSNARAAPVPPPEGPFKAIVAEAVTAALAQAMPRIIVAALTRTPMAKISIGLMRPGGPIQYQGIDAPAKETREEWLARRAPAVADKTLH